MVHVPLRKDARERTEAMPRKLGVPLPMLVSFDALIIVASVPDARGECMVAYAFVPFTVCVHVDRR